MKGKSAPCRALPFQGAERANGQADAGRPGRGSQRALDCGDSGSGLLAARGRVAPGVPADRGHGEPVGDHLPAFGAVAIVVDGVGAVAHRAQQFVAACAGHSPGEEILSAPGADVGIFSDFHTPSNSETCFLSPPSAARRDSRPHS